MVKRSNKLALGAALEEARLSWKIGDDLPTVKKICEQAGVSRATANRDKGFIREHRAVVDKLRAQKETHTVPRRRVPKEDTIRALRTKVGLLANVIASLSVAIADRDGEIASLRQK